MLDVTVEVDLGSGRFAANFQGQGASCFTQGEAEKFCRDLLVALAQALLPPAGKKPRQVFLYPGYLGGVFGRLLQGPVDGLESGGEFAVELRARVINLLAVFKQLDGGRLPNRQPIRVPGFILFPAPGVFAQFPGKGEVFRMVFFGLVQLRGASLHSLPEVFPYAGLPGQGRDHGADDQQRGGCQQAETVLTRKLPELVAGSWWAGDDRVVDQVAVDVIGKVAGRLVAPAPVFVDRLHADPVEITLQPPCQGR